MPKFTSTLVGLVAGALLIAGCSGSPDEQPTTSAGSPSATGAPSSSAAPGVGNQDDALCAAAETSRTEAKQLQSATEELSALMQDPSFMGSEDPTQLNEWGQKIADLSDSSLAFYDLGVTETQGEPVSEDFAALSAFVEKYTMGLANAAVSASSPDSFIATVTETFADPEIQEVATQAPAAAQSVATYIGERCGITG